ncbi:MAG: precorrin-4 C(11)-methyltransferase [Deltaproteobacteria bacterium]|nr:precorrin-4 C(11)-methyltransferase [Deltaproteobacteria bacterium]
MSGRKENPVLFVGAGPGDPELITVAGKKALEQADLVVYAGSLVSAEMLTWCQAGVEAIDSAGLNLDQIVGHLSRGWQAGLRVVRLHTGDPSLYGAIAEQMRRLTREGVPYRVIPGVTAAFAASAALGLEYTLPELCQTLILTRAAGRTPVPPGEDLASLAAHGASMAIYLSVGQSRAVSEVLAAAFGPDAPVAVVYRASWPDQKVVWTTAARLADDLAAQSVTRQALILAGPSVAALARGDAAAESQLYDAGFSHGYRPAGAE